VAPRYDIRSRYSFQRRRFRMSRYRRLFARDGLLGFGHALIDIERVIQLVAEAENCPGGTKPDRRIVVGEEFDERVRSERHVVGHPADRRGLHLAAELRNHAAKRGLGELPLDGLPADAELLRGCGRRGPGGEGHGQFEVFSEWDIWDIFGTP